MSYSSEFTPIFLRHLKKLDPQVQGRILIALEDILQSPREGSQLVHLQQVSFKWRVGDYRIIYVIDERKKAVTFVLVDHRNRVYSKYR
ncbi:MAG: type II toxin-antitoxin system RelE family toxin [Nitrososphaerales archaeon]